jgi:glycosyltransferase involved in cell wall biosynthesis
VIAVGVDYWLAVTHAPGSGRYVRELVRALAPRSGELELKLLEFGPGERVLGEPHLGLANFEGKRLRAKAPRRLLDWSARIGVGADRWLGGCDLFHGPFAGAPRLSRALRTCSVSEFPSPERDETFGADLRRCAAVITFSRFAAEQLVRRYGLDGNAVHALPVGCEHWRRALGRELPLESPPRVLVLGRLDERRNPLAVLRACEQLVRDGTDLRLAYVGRPGDAYDALRAYVTRSPISSRVSWSSTPREEELPTLVARAAVLVHLSDGELTPVTPLEALALGCTVVATRAPAFVEALGPQALWLDAPAAEVEPAKLAAQIATALAQRDDVQLRHSRQALAAAYSWRRHADLTLQIWRDVLDRDGAPSPPLR